MINCPRCDMENPDGFSYCGFCSAPLGEGARPDEEQERKVISVLFCDLVGFTAHAEQADPEDVRARLVPYHARLKDEIERFGGRVEKFVGDAVMAVFGAPVVHEDDAERAVLAGLRILKAIIEMNEERASRRLAVRIGINTGQTLVELAASPERGETMVMGDVVNTASRLQGAAPIGEVVVGEATYWGTRNTLRYEELDPVQLKGKSGPTRLWRAIERRGPTAGAFPVPTTQLVGRGDDIAFLKQELERTIHERSARLVTLVGEPGIGKTRLVTELRSHVAQAPVAVKWRQGKHLPYGDGVSFWALGEIVKAEAGILDTDSRDLAADKLARSVVSVVSDPSLLAWVGAALGPLVGIPASPDGGSPDRTETFTAWRRYLEGIAEARPCVVVVEDLHWADDAMLAFLESLASSAPQVPMLILATARPELLDRHPTWGGQGSPSSIRTLEPLSEGETSGLLRVLLDGVQLPRETEESLLERAGGNPLYAEEYCRLLIDRGFVKRMNGEMLLDADGGIPVPETVEAMIAARIDTLSPEQKSLLQDAAVAGRTFWPSALAHMTQRSEQRVAGTLDELVRTQLIRRLPTSSIEGQLEYSFWHALVRDVAYGELPRLRRALAHRAVGEWLEKTVVARIEDLAEILAHHYRQALQLARAAEDRDLAAELMPAASRVLVMAGDRALNLDVTRSRELYSEALELWPPGSEPRAWILVKAAEAAEMHGDYDAAVLLAQEGVDAFSRAADGYGVGAATTELGVALCNLGETSKGRWTLEGAIARLEQHPVGSHLVRAYGMRAGQALVEGRSLESIQWSELELTSARAAGFEDRALYARIHLDVARYGREDTAALDDLRLALGSMLERGESPPPLVYGNLGVLEALASGPSTAIGLMRTAAEGFEKRGQLGRANQARANCAFLLLEMGEWDGFEQQCEGLLEWAEGHDDASLTVFVKELQVGRLLDSGRVDEAARLSNELMSHVGELDDVARGPSANLILAELAHVRGQIPEARSHLKRWEEGTREDASVRMQSLAQATRTAFGLGESELAAQLSFEAESKIPRNANNILSAQALVAEADGAPERAASMFDDASERWRAFGHQVELAHAIFGAGRCHLAVGEQSEGSVRLAEARALFATMGAPPALVEIDALSAA